MQHRYIENVGDRSWLYGETIVNYYYLLLLLKELLHNKGLVCFDGEIGGVAELPLTAYVVY